jgi:hypothetical protein
MSDLSYKIAVDAAQADAELARLHQSATTLAKSEDQLAASTTAATTALTQQGDASASTAAKTETLRQRIGKLPDVLGKQAAAISLVSSSMEGQNGQIGKLVAGAGQMAAAYGAGGPFALALVGGMAVVAQLTDHWKSLNDEEERAIKLKYAGIDAASDEKAKLQARLVDLRRQADPVAAAKADRESTVAAIEKLRAQTRGLEVAAMQYGVSKEDAVTMRARAGIQRDQLDLMQEELDLRDKIAAKGKEVVKTEKPRAAARAAAAVAGPDTLLADDAAARLAENAALAQQEVDERQRAQDAIDEIEEEALEARLDREQRIADNNERFRTQNYNQAKEAAAALVAVQEEYANAAIGIFASSTTQLMADLIGGQEKAFEKMGANILAQSGTFVVGKGIEAAADGASRLIRGDVTGAVPLAGGLALVGLGASMGGIGSAWATQLGGGGASGDRGPSSRGVPSGPATPGNGSTATNVTIVYAGASGPTADHGARAVTDATERARDRQLRRPEVR